MPNETLHDLMREVGLVSAWEGTPQNRAGYRPPRPLPRVMRQPQSSDQFRQNAFADTSARGAYSEPRNQFAEAGMQAMETTGAPAIARGIRHVGAGEPGEAIPEFLMGGLGALGTATLPFGGGARAPQRVPRVPQAMEAPPRLPSAPPRLPTRATDGSILPARPPEPFRSSLRGGSEDLAQAARSGPDAEPVQIGRLRDHGFDVETPFYRGHDGDPSTGHWRTSEGMNGDAVYITREEPSAERWALRQAENDPTVHTIHTRGRIADSRDGITFEEAQAQGYSALDYYEDGRYVETAVFNAADVSPSVARRSARTAPDGRPVQAGSQGDVLNWLGNDRLIRNPTDAALTRLAELGDEMKYVMDTDGNVYAFSAADAHHNNAMRALRDNGVNVRSLGPGAEVTDPDAAGFIWRNRDGSFVHENADMVESGPFAAFQQRMRPTRTGLNAGPPPRPPPMFPGGRNK